MVTTSAVRKTATRKHDREACRLGRAGPGWSPDAVTQELCGLRLSVLTVGTPVNTDTSSTIMT